MSLSNERPFAWPTIQEEQVIVGIVDRHTKADFRMPFRLRGAKRASMLFLTEGILARRRGCTTADSFVCSISNAGPRNIGDRALAVIFDVRSNQSSATKYKVSWVNQPVQGFVHNAAGQTSRTKLGFCHNFDSQ